MRKILAKLISSFIPVRKWRYKTRAFIMGDFIPLFIIKARYRRKIKELKSKQIINIAFFIWENQKWNGDALYKKFMTDKRFNPKAYILHNNLDTKADEDNLEFFKQRDYNSVNATDNNLSRYEFDIIFYQQAWFVLSDTSLSPAKMSKYALCLYYHYAISDTTVFPNIWKSCEYFFQSIYAYFVFNEEIRKQSLENAIATGHPKLDIYSSPVKTSIWKTKKFKIIYAPHHSFEKGSLEWATFCWNGYEILELAQKNQQSTEWIFKPHPSFKRHALLAKIMTEQEIDEYFSSWVKVGQIYDMGDYFDMFRTSDMLITDCGSFLTEYLPTENPVLHLLNSDKQIFSRLERRSSEHYYKIHNLQELNQMFDTLVRKKRDSLRPERLKDIKNIFSSGFNATDNIYKYVKSLAKENK
ncbi:MAG: CDP-glycerol glycerophosphotransferase family protein [Elusimicrobiota bacterium]|jgi:hypothetical protein|nr:CDP-glycerol glycerophosphotransferase family protein [Elusimicrobiota bacterium]